MDDHQFCDYYELLQVSPNADPDTIRRIFKHLAKKCHPDLNNGGDAELFRQLLKAHEVLTDPEARATYDVRYQEYWDRKWNLVRQAADGRSSLDNVELRERLLTLFYVQRRTDMRHPGLGDMELARLLRTPIEFVEFELWYLKEKGWIHRLESGHLAISVAGVDEIERGRMRFNEDRLLEAHNPTPEESLSESQQNVGIS